MRFRAHFLIVSWLLAASAVADTGFSEIKLKPAEILGEAGAARVADILPADEEIIWRLYVPHAYDPANPPGAMVFLNAIDWGGIPKRWVQVMDDHNLIWISASNAGNDHPLDQRMLKAILSPAILNQKYKVSAERTYVGGYAGGSEVAMMVQTARPELFRGGIYMAGAIAWDNKVPPKLELMKQNHHVFLVGTEDKKIKKLRRVYRSYEKAGIETAQLMLMRGHNHYLPPAEDFGKAIDYLDSRISPAE